MSDWFQRTSEADAGITTGPHGWIQWKGTDVCMDVHCSCGELTHIDDSFTYHIQCGACGAQWHVCSNVRLIPVEPDDQIGDVKVTAR